MISNDSFQSRSGYFGAFATFLGSLVLLYLKDLAVVENISNSYIFLLVLFVFFTMLLTEYYQKNIYNKKHNISKIFIATNRSNLYIAKSAFLRFIVLFLPFLVFYLILNHHNYFIKNNFFAPTVEFFDWLLYIFLSFGFVYNFITLKYKGDRAYEFGDYAVLSIIAIRSIIKQNTLHKNRRVKKIFLIYLVNFFFLSLMIRFIAVEFHAFENSFANYLKHGSFDNGYWTMFHLIFVVDLTIAIIAYTFPSRWLDNRIKSVDMTMSGWVVAIMCYPPLNYAFVGEFVNYNNQQTVAIFTNEYILMALSVLTLFMYLIYVWATAALGFKFGNLTNKGIVTIGPYRHTKHPAYISKNISWWLENSYVLSNIWATAGLATWNTIYWLRGKTEERHLLKDKNYIKYSEKFNQK